MTALPSRPLNPTPVNRVIRKNPLVFGIPFVLLMVGASFALSSVTQTRYDLHDQKNTTVSQEGALGLKKNRKKFDIREEYFRLSSEAEKDWEPVRVPRPKGLPEWGVPPPEPPSNSNPESSNA